MPTVTVVGLALPREDSPAWPIVLPSRLAQESRHHVLAAAPSSSAVRRTITNPYGDDIIREPPAFS